MRSDGACIQVRKSLGDVSHAKDAVGTGHLARGVKHLDVYWLHNHTLYTCNKASYLDPACRGGEC